MTIQNQIQEHALNHLGFDDCRFTDAGCDAYLDEYRQWLARGLQADMGYLQEHLSFKENPKKLFNDALSAIIVIKNYKNTAQKRLTGPRKIARYAVGQDYHVVMQNRMNQLVAFVKTLVSDINCYSGVDSRPLAERTLALKAGIGFRGKNTMVIKPGLGSYFFIGVILTNHAFEVDHPMDWNCGQCRLCVDQCPTHALEKNETGQYWVNASKCISYQTIEKKEPMSQAELNDARGWMFGCDICQEVCPYNAGKIPMTDWKEFLPADGVGFNFLDQKLGALAEQDIPKTTPLYRSRKRVVSNVNRVSDHIQGK